MSKFDRYILSQCFSVFGFFLLVFFLVVWINRAVILFDELIGDGHSAFIFLEFSALVLPDVIAAVAPLASFSATLYVTNRLSNESELAVIQATGFSPWRLSRPFVIFGACCALFVSIFSLYLVPHSGAYKSIREAEVSADLATTLLKEGIFQHPVDGVTFYIREINTKGELKDIYLSDRRDTNQSVTATASTAYLVRQEDESIIVLKDGQLQNFEPETQTLSVTNFTDWTYKFDRSKSPTAPTTIAISLVPTTTLIFDRAFAQKISRRSKAFVNEELNVRIELPLLAFATALVGFASIYVAGFSRFGAGRYMIFGIFLLVIMKMIESAVTKPTRVNFDLWPLIYAPSAFGILAFILMLYVSDRPRKVAPPVLSTEDTT